ncbi:PPOX class F420-dependent oxidoreductase [Ktedonosporobacter rubrisoli]|uniref:PPOX class F420-dependent oxidoreductase n=1 Tax=Ktedonosporobacter rubrisoli TaxID=2509675 RepID=A0A4P6JN01_KTERU|nr:PPOX class F420-dependent oxidoreductase [Ktedonosporobacter rubrisoli]QBD76659.1 PPOX class F420-dependent oxidoreductase [Ktedonosporobacter rubrisoli]
MGVLSTQEQTLLKTQVKALASMATLGPQGEPHNSPLWFEWDGTYIKFSLTSTRQKFRNVQRDPRVALSIIDPNDSYHYLEIRGKVARIEDDTDTTFVNTLARKYLGTDAPENVLKEQRITVYVLPQRIFSVLAR